MAEYYASPTGTAGGAGSLGDPFDITTGFASLAKGDTLYLRGGVYDTIIEELKVGPDTVTLEADGVTVTNYLDEVPQIDASNIPWAISIDSTNFTFNASTRTISSPDIDTTLDSGRLDGWYVGNKITLYEADSVIGDPGDSPEAGLGLNNGEYVIESIIDANSFTVELGSGTTTYPRYILVDEVAGANYNLHVKSDRAGWVEGAISTASRNWATIENIEVIAVTSPVPRMLGNYADHGISTYNNYFKVGVRATNCDDVTVRNCYFTHTASSAVYIGVATRATVDNNIMYRCTDRGAQEIITAYSSTDCIISNNFLDQTGNINNHYNGLGIDIKSGAQGHKIFGNTITNRGNTINIMIAGIYLDARGGVDSLEIYNNKIYNDDIGNQINHGIVIADEVPGSIIQNIKAYNNLIYNCGGGFTIGWAGHSGINLQDCYFTNNTIYNTNNGFALYTYTTGGGNLSSNINIYNNIMRNQVTSSISTISDVNMSSYAVDTNVMDSRYPVGLTVVNGMDVDPLFTDTANGDFTLPPTSPAVNTGTNSYYVPTIDYIGSVRPVGVVDLGAYEYQGEIVTGNYRLTGKAFTNRLGIMKRALTTAELEYLNYNPDALGVIANGGTSTYLPNLTSTDFSNYLAFDEGVGTAHDDITGVDETLDDGAVWVNGVSTPQTLQQYNTWLLQTQDVLRDQNGNPLTDDDGIYLYT